MGPEDVHFLTSSQVTLMLPDRVHMLRTTALGQYFLTLAAERGHPTPDGWVPLPELLI